MYGGSMRQAGIVAAGALYGLDHNVERLVEDHANARLLAELLAGIDGVEIDPATVESNLVFFSVADGSALVAGLAAEGVEMSNEGPRVRAVTHLDVDRDGIERAAAAVASVLAG
jgi:threonine aldolase